jgi:hypothetical protein
MPQIALWIGDISQPGYEELAWHARTGDILILEVGQPEELLAPQQERVYRLRLLLGPSNLAGYPVGTVSLRCHHNDENGTSVNLRTYYPLPPIPGHDLFIEPYRYASASQEGSERLHVPAVLAVAVANKHMPAHRPLCYRRNRRQVGIFGQ